MRVSAAVLAGGQARRMGGVDKRSLRLGLRVGDHHHADGGDGADGAEGDDGADEALGQRIADRLHAHFGEVIEVSARGEGDNSPHASRGARVAQDLVPGFGPLSGLHAALRACRTEWLYLVACDMPHFSADWADFLVELAVRAGGGSVSGAAAKAKALPMAYLAGFRHHIEPFHALYSVRCIQPLERFFAAEEGGRHRGEGARGRRPSIRDFLSGVSHWVIPEQEVRAFSPDWDLFYNLNSPDDLESYRNRMLRLSAS